MSIADLGVVTILNMKEELFFDFLFDPIQAFEVAPFVVNGEPVSGSDLFDLAIKIFSNYQQKIEGIPDGILASGLAKLSFAPDTRGFSLAEMVVREPLLAKEFEQLINAIHENVWVTRFENGLVKESCRIFLDNCDAMTNGRIWEYVEKSIFSCCRPH